MEKPTQLYLLNEDNLREICQQYLDFVGSPEYHSDNDFKHYIFENAMEAVFGPDVWDYINGETK